jgi:thiol-disulfide isomerase/thioredoxin
VVLRLSWLGLFAHTRHDDRDDVVGRGETEIVHDQDLAITEARLAVEVGLSRRFGASVVLPVRVASTSIRYLDLDGMEVQLTTPGIHHRNETLTGLADPMVLGSVAGSLGPVRLTARAGFTIPVGRTEPDPFVLGDLGLPHEHIQLGTGTVNPVVSVDAAHGWGRWRLGGFAFTQQTFYANGHGYQAGDRYAGGITLRRRLGTAWGLRGGVEVQGETAERWGGKVSSDEGNQGRFDAMVAAGVSWSATHALALDATLKIPVITHVVGGQLDLPAIAELGASWSFGGSPPPHRHDHGDHDDGDAEHHDHDAHAQDRAGLDIADLGKPGEAVELVPVPGKLTVFDFGASWCEPCKVLEPALVELARAHPDVVAIRRIDVVDWDSAVVARYLTPGGYSLPHLRIYDRAGTRLLEQSTTSAGLAALIDAVRALVEAADPDRPVVRAPVSSPSARVVAITVTERGFEPGTVKVPHGTPVTLRFERTTEQTCATEVVIEIDGKPIVQALPLHRTVDLTLTFARPGTVRYACAMNMIQGAIEVE